MALVLIEEVLIGLEEVKDSLDQAVATSTSPELFPPLTGMGRVLSTSTSVKSKGVVILMIKTNRMSIRNLAATLMPAATPPEAKRSLSNWNSLVWK